jgi:very-short-patch-repair endonuclease
MPAAATLREIRRATRHHGVTTRSELKLSQRQTDLCCADGTLVRSHAGVYLDPAFPRSPMQDLAVAVAAGDPLCAAWGRSAAALWRLRDEHPPTPEVVVPLGRLRLIDGATVHRSTALNRSMTTTHQHIRVVKPLVTVLDLGVVVSPVDVADAIIRGRQLRLFSVTEVRATVNRFAKRGRTGIAVARQALELVWIGDRPSESVLEFRFHIGPGRHGLPPYQYQHEVRIGRKRYYIDFAYPEVMLAIEVDGYQQRASKDSLAYDNDRANQLVLAGWTILRFTWDRVLGDPAGVAAEILLKLGQLGYSFPR